MPATATARVRELSRGGRRKNDVIDAAAAASVALLAGGIQRCRRRGPTTVTALLDERRANLVVQRTRSINQLHALLRDLVPGGARTDLSAAAAAKVLTGLRPAGPVETARKTLARDIVAQVRDLDTRLKKITAERARVLAERGTSLTELDGIGPVVAPASWDAPGTPAGSPAPQRSPTMPAPHPSRSPAPRRPATGCPAAGTASSTSPCTSSR